MIEVMYEEDLPVEIIVDGYYIVEKEFINREQYAIYDSKGDWLLTKPTLYEAITYVKDLGTIRSK